MALETWGDFNKQTTSPLVVTYSSEQLTTENNYYGIKGGGAANWWKFVRHATKQYNYVGLSAEAAKRCAEEKTRLYTRPFAHWVQYTDTLNHVMYAMRYRSLPWPGIRYIQADKYYQCVADINVARSAGRLYTVQIQVNEEIVVYECVSDHRVLRSKEEYESIFLDVMRSTGIWKYDE